MKKLTEGSHPRPFKADPTVQHVVRGDNTGNSANDPCDRGKFGKTAERVKPRFEQKQGKRRTD